MLAIERALPLDPLYKYQSLATAELVGQTCKSISENYLYWADPTGFNDPFDCRPARIFQGTEEERKTLRTTAAKAVYPQNSEKEQIYLAESLRDISDEQYIQIYESQDVSVIGKFGICCLSDCCDNILMWSHYSSNHSGVCLGFQPSCQAVDFAGATKVEYSPSRPVINIVHNCKAQQRFDDTFLTKAEQWSYESEWRMIERNITERRRSYSPSALVKVIFGARIKPDNCSKILSAIEVSGATPKLLKAEIDKTRFQINLVKL